MSETINIVFIIYRKWAYEIYLKLKKKFKKINFIVIYSKSSEFKIKGKKNNFIKIKPTNYRKIIEILNKNNVKLVLCYGWSWLIPKEIYQNFICLGLHPSKLPYFKGGSPLQHQIIKGMKLSYVSIFKINKEIDGGEIFKQRKFDISLSINKIFLQITKIGFSLSVDLIKKFTNNELIFKRQKKNNRIYKRRTPSESEFSLDRVKKINFSKFNNFVRALNDPYPNAYFIMGKRTYKVSSIKKIKKNNKIVCLNRKKTISKNIKGNYIELKDSFAKITKGKVVKTKI